MTSEADTVPMNELLTKYNITPYFRSCSLFYTKVHLHNPHSKSALIVSKQFPNFLSPFSAFVKLTSPVHSPLIISHCHVSSPSVFFFQV